MRGVNADINNQTIPARVDACCDVWIGVKGKSLITSPNVINLGPDGVPGKPRRPFDPMTEVVLRTAKCAILCSAPTRTG